MSNSGQAAKPQDPARKGNSAEGRLYGKQFAWFQNRKVRNCHLLPRRKVERCQEGGALCILCNILLYCIFCRFSSRFFYCLNADVFARFRRFFGGAGGCIAAQAVERRAVPFWLFPVRGRRGLLPHRIEKRQRSLGHGG